MALLSRRDLRAIAADSFSKTASINREKHTDSSTRFDVFLSHSYKDASSLTDDELYRIKKLIESFGLSVYVDWIVDPHLDRTRVTSDSARILRNRMDKSKCLLFATTQTSSESKWMPWELGYIDGKTGKAAILPIIDQSSSGYSGQEYLGIYPHIAKLRTDKGYEKLFVLFNRRQYLELTVWINGSPAPRTSNHDLW